MLRRMPVGLVVATSTLEVGIDIGDVDTCILFDAPEDPNSLLQRAGRAGRRDGKRRLVYTPGLFDPAVDFAKVIGKAQARSRPSKIDARPWLSGCIQQCASYVTGRGEVDWMDALSFLIGAFGMTGQTAEALVTFLVAERMLEARKDQLVPGPVARELFERRSLHLTFAGYGGDRIVDEATGRTVGVAIARPGEPILLGGKGRKVTGVVPGSGAVVTRAVEGGTASFAPAGRSPFEALAKRCAPRLGGQFRT